MTPLSAVMPGFDVSALEKTLISRLNIFEKGVVGYMIRNFSFIRKELVRNILNGVIKFKKIFLNILALCNIVRFFIIYMANAKLIIFDLNVLHNFRNKLHHSHI